MQNMRRKRWHKKLYNQERIYTKNKQPTKISFYIGEFNKVHYQPMLKKYAHNRILFFVLEKTSAKIL